MHSQPEVSIGLPIYNGEGYLAAALESVLIQTFADLEVIICDNASSDRTEAICRDYVSRDPRVRYVRSDRNLGAAPNYNRAFALAKGRFFKWLAHDDMLAPSFLEEAAAALDADPSAVLCQSPIRFIDERGRSLGAFDGRMDGTDSRRPSIRFGAVVLPSHPCTAIFGLLRRCALIGSPLLGSYHGCDRALLARLALRGRFLHLPEPLLMIREHPGRYTRSKTRPQDRRRWHDTGNPGQLSFPSWRLYGEYLRMVREEVAAPTERLRCYRHLSAWWGRNWNSARMAVDLLGALLPGVVGRAERVKWKLFGAAPGHFVGKPVEELPTGEASAHRLEG